MRSRPAKPGLLQFQVAEFNAMLMARRRSLLSDWRALRPAGRAQQQHCGPLITSIFLGMHESPDKRCCLVAPLRTRTVCQFPTFVHFRSLEFRR